MVFSGVILGFKSVAYFIKTVIMFLKESFLYSEESFFKRHLGVSRSVIKALLSVIFVFKASYLSSRIITIQGDQLNMAVFFWYLVKLAYPVYVAVHVYTE